MSTIQQAWGRHVPQELHRQIAAAWGARAIYSGRQIDLLHDRQSWYVDGFSIDDNDPSSTRYGARQQAMKPLMSWINKVGLPFLRKESKTLDPDESRVVSRDDGLFHIEASPQRSFGYLYIGAWQLKLTPAERAAFERGNGTITTSTAAKLLSTTEDEVTACLRIARKRGARP